MTDPDLNYPDGNTDTRLVPLDPWERAWIKGSVEHALVLMGTIAESTHRTEAAYRLTELSRKMYVPPEIAEGLRRLAAIPPEPN